MNLAEQLAARGAAQAGGKRAAGSTRFAAYYKVQVFSRANDCWIDMQVAYATPEAARTVAGRLRGKPRWRIMEVTPKGRRPV